MNIPGISKFNRIKPAWMTFYGRQKHRSPAVVGAAIVVACVMIIVILLATAPQQQEQPSPEVAWPVSALVVQLKDASPMAPLFGRLESPREARINSRLAADVTAVNVLEGQRVERGDVLLYLDETELRLNVEQSRANSMEAQAHLESVRVQAQSDSRLLEHQRTLWQLTEKNLQRQEKLLADQAISQSLYDNSLLQAQKQAIELEHQQAIVADAENIEMLAEAKRRRAQAELARAELQLSYTAIKAPFDGVISKVLVSEGDRLQVGTEAIEMFDRSVMRVRASIPSDYVSRLKRVIDEGGQIQAVAEAYDQRIELTLDNLTSSVSNNGVSVDGLFSVEQNTHWLVLGQMLSVSLFLPPERSVALVPPQAVYDESRVYAIEHDRLVPVEVNVRGERKERGRLEVLLRSSQLRDGMVLLGSRLPQAKNGLKVSPLISSGKTDALAAQSNVNERTGEVGL